MAFDTFVQLALQLGIALLHGDAIELRCKAVVVGHGGNAIAGVVFR